MSPSDLALLNPNTRTCPIFPSGRDAELTKHIYRRVPVLIREGLPAKSEENPWRISFMAMLHMANDSHLFVSSPDSGRLPLYEAKMVHHFDHRFGDYADKAANSESTALPSIPAQRLTDPQYVPCPRYWVDEEEVNSRLANRWNPRWLLGWRDICRATDFRTVIAAVIPRSAVNDKFLLMLPAQETGPIAALAGNLSSLVLDYAARQKLGGTSLKYL